MGRRILLFLLPLLLVLPFATHIPQMERMRRGLFLVLVAFGWLVPGNGRLPGGTALRLPFLLAGYALLAAFWAEDPLGALEGGAWILALALAPGLGPRSAGEGRAFCRGLAACLVLTSAYGLAQAAGLEWPAGYTVPHEPVTTLGNRNVAAEWTALAAAPALAAGPVLGPLASALGFAYLLAIGARGGLLAFALLAAVLWFRPRWLALEGNGPSRRIAALGLAAAIPLGLLLRPPPPPPAPPATAGTAAPASPDPSRTPSTLDVRFEIWRASLRMAKEALPLGLGPLGFRARFPEFRTPREIELSSFGHRFGTRVLTPHNDALQILLELGLPGILLAGGFLLLLSREARQRIEGRRPGPPPLVLVTLGSLLVLGLTRAPLGNAAAAGPALLLLGLRTRKEREARGKEGRAGGEEEVPPPGRSLSALLPRAAALLLLLPGASILSGHVFGASFLRAQDRAKRAAKAGGALESRELLKKARRAISEAVRLDPLETDWRLLRAQRLRIDRPEGKASLRAAAADLEAVLARRPGSYLALLEMARLGLESTALRDRGRKAGERLLRLDPGHPAALQFAVEYAFLDGRFEEALAALERARDKTLCLAHYRQVGAMAARARGARRARLLRLRLELGRLGRKLFPNEDAFR